MSSDHRLAVLSVDQRNQLEVLLMEFDESWSPGLLEDFVQHVQSTWDHKLRTVLLSELVKIDLQRRWTSGQGRILEDYGRLLPELGFPDSVDPELILFEFEVRREVDPQLDLGSYEARFPRQIEKLECLLRQLPDFDPGTSEATSDLPPDQASVQTSRVDHLRDTVVNQNERLSELPVEFGRYRILRELGSGAMGAVYLAHDTQLDRPVALKTPSFDGLKDEELIARFYREAKAAAKLQHRNLCPIYDVGEIDGRHFISMAFIKGRCLSEFIRPDKLPPVQTSAILILRLATALAEAHHNNVVHRDLKPANIMVDLKKEPVVMDFGLARQTDIESRVTQSGMMVGTPAYMSPEQISGDQQDVGPASDIYSLGVIFYELLTGRLPFHGSIAQVVHQITSDEPKPPSQIRKTVDPELEAICGWMMAKDRAIRFESMDEVANALRKYLKTPRVASHDEINQKYARPSLQTRGRADETDASSKSDAEALNRFFAEQANDNPLQTVIESTSHLPDAPRVAVPKRRAANRGDHRNTILIASSWIVGVLITLGIIFYLTSDESEVEDGTNSVTAGNGNSSAPADPQADGRSSRPQLVSISELNIGNYNTSPWPSRDGLRLYWETQQPDRYQSRTVTLMASRPDLDSKFGPAKFVAEGRMATLSPDELEIVCVPNDGEKSLYYARRHSIGEPFPQLQPIALTNEPANPKSPCFSPDGLHFYVQSSQPESNEFLHTTRLSPSHPWAPLRQFGRMHEQYHKDLLTWPFVSSDGLRIWYGNGGDRDTEIWTGTRKSTDDAFGVFEPVTLNHKRLVGRAPRYVPATRELFFTRPIGEQGWELAIIKNYSPEGSEEQDFVSLFNGKDLSGWTVIGHNGWRVANGTLVGKSSQQRGWLMSDRSYSDFELTLEYLLAPDSNSGIFLRAWPEGAENGQEFHEIQLLDDTSRKYRNIPADQRSGSLFKEIAAQPALQPEPNRWHRLSIRLQRSHLQVSIDGQQVVDSQIPSGKPQQGHLGLQLYPNEVQFWNIRIKDLNKAE